MIFHLREIPFGVYRYPLSTDSLNDLILAKEPTILTYDLDWPDENKSPTTARYGSYNFLTYPGTDDFKAFIITAIDDFYRKMNWDIPTERWVQCWVNIHREGQRLGLHTHHDCKLSGHMTVACNGSYTAYYSSMLFELENEPGLLTLIGAERVPHATSAVVGDQARISIAFDVMENKAELFDNWILLHKEKGFQ